MKIVCGPRAHLLQWHGELINWQFIWKWSQLAWIPSRSSALMSPMEDPWDSLVYTTKWSFSTLSFSSDRPRCCGKAESSTTLLFQSVQLILFRNHFSCCPEKSSWMPQVTRDPQGSWCLTLTLTEFLWRGVWKKNEKSLLVRSGCWHL